MQRWRPSLNLCLMLLITALIGLFCVAAGTYIVKKAQDDIRGEVYSATELIERYLEAQLKLVPGRSAAEIAKILDLSGKTISNYHTEIKQKLNVTTDVELVRIALRHNLLKE